MTDRLKRAALVIKLARRKEDQAAGHLRQWRKHRDRQREQLETLRGYQASYLAQARSHQQSLQQLVTNRQFLAQLEQALGNQQRELEAAEREFERCQQLWLRLHRRRRLLEDYRAQLQGDLQQARDKAWDKLCDELSHRAHRPNI